MDPFPIQRLLPVPNRKIMAWRRETLDKKYQLPNHWDWDGEILQEGEHHHHHIPKNPSLRELFDCIKPERYMKDWAKIKSTHQTTVLFVYYNGWFHAFHQDADVLHSRFNMKYDTGNIARISIHSIHATPIFDSMGQGGDRVGILQIYKDIKNVEPRY